MTPVHSAARLRPGLLRTALVFLLAGTVARAADSAALDAIFARFARPDSPGAALVVIRDGTIALARSYGQATLAPAQPIAADTRFYIGSVSKQFTAAAIALLHRDGKLALDDDIRRYVPELPDYGPKITLRHCVHHTSGLRDYLALRDLAGLDANAHFTDADVLALLRRQQALGFPPGSRYAYSNSGYFVLSLVVRRVSGQSLREFAAARIFGPLGMKTAEFRDDHRAAIPHRADGYSPAPGGKLRLDNPNFDVVGAGGVFMTARDFAAWDRNFTVPVVGDRDFLALLQTPATLNDGARIDYAFGLRVTRYRGAEIVEHGGAYGGFRAHVLRLPAHRLSVVCFTNLATSQPGRLVRDVVDVLIGDQLGAPAAGDREPDAGEPTTPRAPAAASTIDFAAFAGRYFSAELDVAYEIVAGSKPTDFQLRAPRRPAATLTAQGGDLFASSRGRVRFQRAPDGRVASFALEGGRAPGIVFVRQ
jgi:CubicO group peptidase (beta-lactamase class C family)